MEKETLNGFEIFEDFMPGGNVFKTETSTGKEDDKTDIDNAASEPLTDEELEKLRKPEDNDDIDDDDDDIEPEPTKTKKGKKEKEVTEPEPKKEEDVDDDDDADTDDTTDNNTVTTFFEAISEKMGWELGEDDEVPSTPEELVDYFQAVIEENSVPQYASEEVEALDKFVKNGGNLKDYFQIDGELDLEDFEIEDNEVNQKLVIKEFLKEKGFSSKQIDKKLTKYEDAGLLEDEATDALEALRDIREQKKQQLLEEQEKSANELKKRQQEYFNSVVTEIKGMDNIRGIKIPQKDKQALLEYIFKPTADGKTQYQKDYSKSVKNLLESAYFTMKGDTLLKAAKSEGSTAAINKFKNSLSKTGVSRKTRRQDNTSTESMWDSFARQLRVD